MFSQDPNFDIKGLKRDHTPNVVIFRINIEDVFWKTIQTQSMTIRSCLTVDKITIFK